MQIVFSQDTPPGVQVSGRLGGKSLDRAVELFGTGRFETFVRNVSASGGNFAVAATNGKELHAAVDRVRSLPLFYGHSNGAFVLGDDAYAIRKALGASEQDPVRAAELWYMLYVLGDGTLATDVRQLRAGEAIRVRQREGAHGFDVERRGYYSFVRAPEMPSDEYELMERLDGLLVEVFSSMLQDVGGRQLVVPLSGGMDSRLCACMLKRLGAENVLCFTYGKPENPEAVVSRLVAERLGYPWAFVSYDDLDWEDEDCHRDLERFYRFSGNLSALPPALEDWLAIRQMTRQGRLAPDAVFCPGHTAMFSSGGRLAEAVAASKDPDELTSVILRQHAPRLQWQRPKRETLAGIRHDVRETLDRLDGGAHGWDPAALFDSWNWAERQSKRIINMVRAYEFWGYDWRIPLWDSRLMDFWSSVPSGMRQLKRIYHHLLCTRSARSFLGLFNPAHPLLRPGARKRRGAVGMLSKAVNAHPLSRYFLADKSTERLLAGGFGRYLRMVGSRVFSREPVTGPWLLLEKYGLQKIWDPAA